MGLEDLIPTFLKLRRMETTSVFVLVGPWTQWITQKKLFSRYG